MQHPRLTEKEFHMFMRPKKRHVFWHAVAASVLLLFIAGGLFFLLNAPAFLASANTNSSTDVSTTTSPGAIVQTSAPVNAASATSTAQPTPTQTSNIPDNTVSYQGLNISAPITWDVPFDNNTILNDLENGVIHLSGTPHPGEQGYTVVFGHSSYYPWAKGNYKSVFAPLLKAQVGDTFNMSYKGVEYTYKVTRTYQVSPTDLSVLNSSSTVNGARLITCSPIGTSLHRYIVEAVQISPNPANNIPFKQKSFTGSLPSDT